MSTASFVASLLAAVAVFLVLYLLYRLARWARTQPQGAYVLGVAVAPFIPTGNIVDPDFRIANEAKQSKEHEDDDAGDPPNDVDTSATDSARAPRRRWGVGTHLCGRGDRCDQRA